ncbi:MAG: MBOAT family protein [Oscillospiraceae bacterium]|nr:MBOAT family protein [Oscillospiraceae bacterium]
MTYTSPAFMCFVFGVWLLYAALPKKFRWTALLAASVAFYCICDLLAGIWLVLCTFVTFFGGRLVYGQKKSRIFKKIALAATLASVFGLLSVFKFAAFAAALLPSVLGAFSKGLLLPLGISFYIFQSAGYVIDLYRGKYAPEPNIAKYALFVSFFPQIVQGPIGRYDRLAPQLFSGESPNADSYKYGIQLVLWGLFKKMILADRAAVFVNAVFNAPEAHGGVVGFAAAAFYCIQIYCDFSGGIDISRGAAEGLGISLDKNFEQPLFAVSVQDFWRRWHMTLGSWMRDYLFYPLSLSRRFGKFGRSMRKVFGVRTGKLIPSLIATFIVFFTIGIWHGGAWKYIIFGLWNGVLLTSAMFAEPLFAKMRKALHVTEKSKFWHGFRIVRTLFIVGAGRILTRANNTSEALIMLKNIFVPPEGAYGLKEAFLGFGLSLEDCLVMAGAFALLLFADIIEENGISARRFIERRPPVLQVFLIALALFALIYYGAYREGYINAQFLYGRF